MRSYRNQMSGNCYHRNISKQGSYEVMEPKIRDNMPEIRAAGKRIPREGNAKECLELTKNRASTPDNVKPFHGMTQPAAGAQRVIYSFANDPPVAKNKTHGISSKSSLEAGHLINPQPNTLYKQAQIDIKESLYASRENAPLGTMHDQAPGLPEGMEILTTTFGRPVVKGENAGAVVSPAKTPAQVMQEAAIGSELYKKSHLDYDVGETVDRNYDWSKFTKSSLYGAPTPNDPTGKQVKNSLYWVTQAQSERKVPIVVKRLDDFREKSHHQLGKVFDPIVDTLNVPDGHTFGVIVQPDEYGAGKLLQMQSPSSFDSTQDKFDAGLLSTLRQHLKLNNFHSFEALEDAFQQKDEERSGNINVDVLQEICFQFRVPLEQDMLEMLIRWCRVGDEPNLVQYPLFIQYMNWKSIAPSDKLNSTTIGSIPSVQLANRLANTTLGQQFTDKKTMADNKDQTVSDAAEQTVASTATHDGEQTESQQAPLVMRSPAAGDSYRTSSQTIGATVGNITNMNYPSCGVPTIRSDKAAPRIKRVSDNTNYGDESDAYGVVHPSVYATRGVYEKDFFQPRSQSDIKAVFENIGVSLSPEVFKELWEEASRRHPEGKVSVESFRVVMEEVQAVQMANPH